ncbi:putative nucleotidyltransferase [Fervidobacterium pennivorans DSM 9078]|jgi:predicted nucleotidyltransferase|uniref:Nucleotidyltransferase n=1 Tax=Fervidobacterium pennivorans (strain DSM 9078 / Ven5) TaxID=771875 RepID=H9U9V7_FERPD|nr:nucleotidyltransferase family protein [Fervidobacterium pennivorans]AFG34300.1 putative nucleotidyltransferase [Fervidobacterium pennivorans DSM 9078]QIV77662.1 nucleotidyltransferase family protein [Fervidobacterium pennivorans subsp. keratinolyticus]
MKRQEDILKILTEQKQYLVQNFGVEEIALFGSYARGEENEESDIDILVQFKEGYKTFDNYMDLKFYLEELFGKTVDLVIKSAIKPRLKPYILEEAKYV